MLDIERPDDLIAWLRRTGRIGGGETPRVRRLNGGVSNRTMLVERPGGEAWVLKQALEKLRVSADWFSSPTRIRREAMGLRWLSRLLPEGAVPRLAWEEPAEHLLAMEAVPTPHQNLKEMLLRGEGLEQLEALAALLGAIHRGGRAHREEVAAEFDDLSFFHSLRAEPYYRFTAAQVPPAEGFLTRLLEETARFRLTLVHGDFSPKNVLVRDGRVVLLDHEVIHFGDPAFDLGFSLAHLLSKAHHLRHHREAFLAGTERYWKSYLGALGTDDWAPGLEARSVRHALGCLLARVAGRSPLEYLGDGERGWQRTAVVGLMQVAPASLPDLVDAWRRSLKGIDVDH